MKSKKIKLRLRHSEEEATKANDRTGGKLIQLADASEPTLKADGESGYPNNFPLDDIETLGELVKWKQNENALFEKHIQANLERMVYPIIDTLGEHVTPSKRSLVTLLKSCLINILSPMIHELNSKYNTLSPTEIEVCGMISRGYSSKSIASLKDISVLTVNDHRKTIRKKLGLTNSKTNLVSYLRLLEKSRTSN